MLAHALGQGNNNIMTSDSTPSLYRINPLDGADYYQTWKSRMEDILRAQNLWHHVSGTATAPSDKNSKEFQNWEDEDKNALAQIRLRVKDSVVVYVRSAKTAASAWSTLQIIFEAKGPLAKVLARRKLFQAKCEEGESIKELLHRLQRYREDPATLDSIIADDEFSITILAALPDSWDPFTSALDSNALKDPAELIERILERDQRDNISIAKG